MSCVDPNKVVVGNGHIIRVQSIGHSSIKSNCMSNTVLHLNHLTHVPKITRNLNFVSKFSIIGVDCTASTIFLLNLQAIFSKTSHNTYLLLFIIVGQITSNTKEG